MWIVLAACQVFLSLIFLLAVVGKVQNPGSFLTALQVSGLSQRLIIPVTLSIVGAEWLIGINLLLVLNGNMNPVLVAASLLLATFTTWQVYVYKRRISVGCGCFGSTPTTVGRADIVRNSIFLGITGLTFFLAVRVVTPLPKLGPWMLIPELLSAAIVLRFTFQRIAQPIQKPVALQSEAERESPVPTFEHA